MVIMISQPMRGKTTEQIYSERSNLVQELLAQGHEVLDTVFPPTYKFKDPEKENIFFLGQSIEYMANADAVYFMEGWQNARGCVIEHMICEKYGIKILKD